MGTEPSLPPALAPRFFTKILLRSIYGHAYIHGFDTMNLSLRDQGASVEEEYRRRQGDEMRLIKNS